MIYHLFKNGEFMGRFENKEGVDIYLRHVVDMSDD